MAMKPKSHAHDGNGYPSDASGNSSSPSPPPSPRRHASISQCRRRVRSKAQYAQSLKESFGGGILLRRNLRYLLVLPLLYVCGLLMCVAGPFSALVGGPAPPGSVYRSHEMFRRLLPDIQADNSSAIELSSVWKYKRRQKEQRPCPNSTAGRRFESSGPSGYLIVEANGGLNQQRSAICNAVAVAGLLNAILVIPRFHFHSVWKDPSEFGDIYDEDHFIATLEGYVKVVKKLPEVLMESYDYNITDVPTFHVQAWASVGYYLGEVYPVLQKQGVIRIAPFANRLAMNVPPHIQSLRCLTNYEALRFSSPISILAKKLVNRMIEKSSRTGGKYVSIHLRFEEDMVAFSCCVYDGGEAEKVEMDSIREKGWRGKFKRKDRLIQPGLNRINGKCPLSPLEVGMMLRGMGFGNDTSIYLASGKIYQAESHLAPLLTMFPYLYTKESLATPDELAPFKGYSSRLAALDYTVCLFSEVFVTTQGGNFPHFLMGHRRFLYGGHAKTIMPDKRKLVVLMQDMGLSWKAFKDEMEEVLNESDRKGVMVPRVKKFNRKTSVYTFPLPECRCIQKSHNDQINPNSTFFSYHPRSMR
ncbi:O-fucosyltransferase 10-like [Alnus glutinosa]|uniref:O-fucosyltransferase 10-like n=1 Tax=Alnus glutinosa TaxID=3517 RepID=UPI002D78349B|nr:O-fucosyltransferase 10-like [Alnus glutinosa]